MQRLTGGGARHDDDAADADCARPATGAVLLRFSRVPRWAPPPFLRHGAPCGTLARVLRG